MLVCAASVREVNNATVGFFDAVFESLLSKSSDFSAATGTGCEQRLDPAAKQDTNRAKTLVRHDCVECLDNAFFRTNLAVGVFERVSDCASCFALQRMWSLTESGSVHHFAMEQILDDWTSLPNGFDELAVDAAVVGIKPIRLVCTLHDATVNWENHEGSH
jgi:hypothetical protein